MTQTLSAPAQASSIVPRWTLDDVRRFAVDAHANAPQPDGSIGQKRKYTGEPYIVHPLAVAGLVATVPGATQEMIAAALLHDVVEDTGTPLSSIRERFGTEVDRIVDGLSDMQTKADGNRKTRKARECAKLGAADWAIQTVKLADLISNTASIVALDPQFAVTYLEEKDALLRVMTKGDRGLHAMASDLCREGQEKLLREHLGRKDQSPATPRS